MNKALLEAIHQAVDQLVEVINEEGINILSIRIYKTGTSWMKQWVIAADVGPTGASSWSYKYAMYLDGEHGEHSMMDGY